MSSFSGARRVPPPHNDPNFTYAPGSPERAQLKCKLSEMAAQRIEIPLVIGGKEVRTGKVAQAVMPHKHSHVLADWHKAGTKEVQQAVAVAVETRREWANWPWEERAAVFLRAAELLTTTWRQTLNAATMLGQSKTAFQAEIDAASELIDFWRFNVAFAQELYDEQPISTHATWNQSDYRGLEGFVYAVTPFNFTAIGGNLPGAPALMGCTVVWKPASSAMLSAYYIMKLLEAAGLPPGVINFVPGDAAEVSHVVLDHPDFAGRALHRIDRRLQQHLEEGRRQPRHVPLVSAYRRRDRRQGLRGRPRVGRSAGSGRRPRAWRVRVSGAEVFGRQPRLHAEIAVADIKERMLGMVAEIKMGDVRDFRNFMGAVIDDKAFTKIGEYIADAEEQRDDHRRRRLRRRRLLHPADHRAGDAARLSPDVRRDLRARADRLRLQRQRLAARCSRSWTRRHRTR